MVTVSNPPALQVNPRGGKLRFACIGPKGRSLTWTVWGTGQGDVYVGARSHLRHIKLSAHQSDVWRLAFVEGTGLTSGDTGDRLIHHFTPRAIGGGWRLLAQIVIVEHLLATPFRESPPKRSAPVSVWPVPDPGREVQFDILTAKPGMGTLTVEAAGEVGRMTLTNGSSVWVVISEFEHTKDKHTHCDHNLLKATTWTESRIGVGGEHVQAVTYAESTDGVPLLLDMGNGTGGQTPRIED